MSSSSSSSSSRPVGVTMKGKIASRAHSFKENILEALGHHGHHGHVGGLGHGSSEKAKLANGASPQSSKAAIQLAKKTNSTDNLIGYSEPKQSTDGLVRDVQLALRYFEVIVIEFYIRRKCFHTRVIVHLRELEATRIPVHAFLN